MTRAEAAQAIKDLAWDSVGLELTLDPEDITPYMDFSDIDVEQTINEQGEIIYYARAIEYLSKHDASLRESLDIAADCGYSVQDLSSEILASLHNMDRLRSEWYDLETEINNILLEVEDDDDDE